MSIVLIYKECAFEWLQNVQEIWGEAYTIRKHSLYYDVNLVWIVISTIALQIMLMKSIATLPSAESAAIVTDF